MAEVLVAALTQIGVQQVFGLIGDSLNPLGDAIRRSKIEWIGVRHEEGAALAAAGQAKLTGRLGVCAGTTGPGSTHLVAGPYAQSGQLQEARKEVADVLRINPAFTIESWKRLAIFKNPEDADHLIDGIRKAGLPEA